MTDRQKLLLVVDGNSLVHRAFHTQAGVGMRSGSGRPIWAVRGLLLQLLAAVNRIEPDALLVGFDDPDTSIRRERWPHYKAGRAEKSDALVEQLQTAASVLTALGAAVITPTGWEADDVLASAARFAPEIGARTVIMTSDRDAFALIDEHTRVLRIINGGVEASPLLTADRLQTMIGVRPDQYRDFAALRGDPSDNLPGVLGIGAKTAAKLLTALGGATEAFADVAGAGRQVIAAVGAAAAAKLGHPQARSNWELNCQIMTMRTDLPIAAALAGPTSAGGCGSLPLAPEAVREVFQAHRLTGSVASALRSLAHDESGAAAVDRSPSQAASIRWTPTPWAAIPSAGTPWTPAPSILRRRTVTQAQLVAKRRENQLTLF